MPVATGRSEVLFLETILQRGRRDKVRQLMSAEDHVLFVENTFRKTPEESRRAILRNETTRTEKRRV